MSDYQHWYYINKNYEEDGPVSSDELARMVSSGELRKGTYVWTQELDEWVPASKVGGLFNNAKQDIPQPLNGISKKNTEFGTAHESLNKKDVAEPKPKLKNLAPHTRTGYLGKNKTGYLNQSPIPTPTSTLGTPQTVRQPDRRIGAPAKPRTSLERTTASSIPPTSPVPQNPAVVPNPKIIKAPTSHVPVPLSAPVELVPKPITAKHNIAPSIPGSFAHNPTTAAGANSIPVPLTTQTTHSATSPPPPSAPGLPPAPTPPGSMVPPPPPAGLPQIPPVGRSIAPFNQTPTSALIQADDEIPAKKGPRPMSRE